ncbi:DUF1134 domain-containing protein [Stenotrophobium rhamnosiphilum]|uniref:DUF1134 domain-containing protein n=1 Tax=Stenotrophobium rhamnosiphilum TaxID=2029166 RepID=A0A2T5MJP7_9GAMM|nr:DUF1134 domain-containing protein [Stenotrophobium rhamnosiphilum]PTU32797.1 DUF1134 domain-containing protein [Stenotrophobium rhamnosiphilum]
MRKTLPVGLLTSLLLSACVTQQPIDSRAEISAPTAPASASPAATNTADHAISNETYSAQELISTANHAFGDTSEGLAKAIEKAFSDFGSPNAYIIGDEGSGAMVVGLRYGKGTLHYKGGDSMPVYWQGPSIGWDFGGNASKVFTLVYNLRSTYDLFQRYPAVDGSLYVVAGVGMNYQRVGDVTLAPIRTGVGLRAGASLGYVNYTRTSTVNPF